MSLESTWFSPQTTEPHLGQELLEPIQPIIKQQAEIENPQERAALVMALLNNPDEPYNLAQQVWVLLKIDDETFAHCEILYREFALTARAAIDGNMPRARSDTVKQTVRDRARTFGTARYLVEAGIRRRMVNGTRTYPETWDEDLWSDPRFKPDDELPRMSFGRKINYDEAVALKRATVAYDFVSFLHPHAASHEDPVSINPAFIYARYLEYATTLPLKPGNDINLHDLARAADAFEQRYSGNQQIGDWCKLLKEVIQIIIDSIDEEGNINPHKLPDEPNYTYPKFKRSRPSW